MKKRKWNSGFAHGAGIPLEYIEDFRSDLDDKEMLDAGYAKTGGVREDEFWNEDAADVVSPCRSINPTSAEGRAISERLGVAPSVTPRAKAA